MQFGKVANPANIDFTLPPDHPNTRTIFNPIHKTGTTYYIGCAKWNKQDLKNFYPRGTKDELKYYSSQFNAIELNATFYKIYSQEQILKWKEKTSSNFKFYPKIIQDISHIHKLSELSYPITEIYTNNVRAFGSKLGCVFLQMHENYSPNEFETLKNYINMWPGKIPLAIELRHTDWFNTSISTELYQFYVKSNISNIITDTAGRRDLIHMSLTSPNVFIRFVGANHSTDYLRLDSWIDRLTIWHSQGLKSISFFIHQNTEIESVKLSSYFIKKLNERLKLNIKIPLTLEDIQSSQQTLF
ncbi:DUF72 domain-containing protein [Wenyingzhuangia sp. IMCC45533]